MATKVDELKNIIATSNDPAIVDIAQKQLDALESIGGAQVQIAQATQSQDPEILAVLGALEKIIQSGGGGNVSQNDLRKAINEELKIRKITKADLSPDLLAFIESERKVQITINQMLGVSSVTSTKGAFVERPLAQLLLSDVSAKNNAYLYGGAGTGKTFIAEQIAKLLGWEAITLNCNQFTSPIDILGGQTIDGYQEGKLSMAWSNEVINQSGIKEKKKGCVLILDELPKIDPNTAGILNDALAKVKNFGFDDKTGLQIPPTIRNGKNEVLTLGNLFVVATGNVALNTIDPDYEANFKQDLSLQDRFIGSTYKINVDYEYEFKNIMKGYAFIWIYLQKVRESIITYRAQSEAFVSLRLMLNVKATYDTYRDVLLKTKNAKMSGATSQLISKPKTIIESMESFFNLLKPTQKDAIMKDTDFNGFKKIVLEKNKMPFYDDKENNFDTPNEIQEGEDMLKKLLS
jgi:cobaltochelatase CobS